MHTHKHTHTHTLYSNAPSIPLCPYATQLKLKHHCMKRKTNQCQTAVWCSRNGLVFLWPLASTVVLYVFLEFRKEISTWRKCRLAGKTYYLEQVVSSKWDIPSKSIEFIGTESSGRVTSDTWAHINFHTFSFKLLLCVENTSGGSFMTITDD